MKEIIRLLTITALCAGMLFLSACGDGSDQQSDTKAMGRYVESSEDLPEGISPFSLLQRSDDTLDIMAFDDNGSLVMYSKSEGGDWSKTMDLNIPMDINTLAAAYDSSDVLHLLASGYQPVGDDDYKGYTRLFKVNEDQSLEEIDIQWIEEEESNIGVMASGIKILENGDFIISQFRTGHIQYGSDGSYKNTYLENDGKDGGGTIQYSGGNDNSYAAVENRLYIQDPLSASIQIFNTDTYAMENAIPFDNSTSTMVMAKGLNGDVYVINSNGMFRMLPDGSLWERIVDGDLSSLSLPTTYPGDMVSRADGSYYLLASVNSEMKLLKYIYDETIASVPEKEIVVYTLEENPLVRQAAGEFQRTHPDTKINIQVASGNGSVTASELVRALNTELLAGKGPDILVLDGMNIDSYIDKKVLADISDVINEADNTGEGLLDAAMEAFAEDGNIYAIPLKISLPVMVAENDVAAQLKTIEEAADFAAKNPDRGLIGVRDPEILMELFLPVCAPAWISDGKIDQSELEVFLASLKSIYDVSAENYPESEEEYDDSISSGENLFHWAYGRAHTQMTVLNTGYNTLAAVSAGMDVKADAGITFLPGQVEGGYIPTSIVGINANSDVTADAKEFISLLLSEEVQMSAVYNGFPVNLDALENSIVFHDNIYMSTRNFYNGESLQGGWPSIEIQQMVKELCLNAKTPFNMDDALVRMIIDEGKGYLTGSKSLKEAIDDIDEATKIYLSE